MHKGMIMEIIFNVPKNIISGLKILFLNAFTNRRRSIRKCTKWNYFIFCIYWSIALIRGHWHARFFKGTINVDSSLTVMRVNSVSMKAGYINFKNCTKPWVVRSDKGRCYTVFISDYHKSWFEQTI